jgi:hypothetical protein
MGSDMENPAPRASAGTGFGNKAYVVAFIPEISTGSGAVQLPCRRLRLRSLLESERQRLGSRKRPLVYSMEHRILVGGDPTVKRPEWLRAIYSVLWRESAE